jgi:hypothetical protein
LLLWDTTLAHTYKASPPAASDNTIRKKIFPESS